MMSHPKQHEIIIHITKQIDVLHQLTNSNVSRLLTIMSHTITCIAKTFDKPSLAYNLYDSVVKNVGKDKSLVNDILINILPTSINDLQADYISVYESCEHIENSKQNTEQSHTQVTQSKEAIIELACDIDNITEQVNELANKTQAIASIVDSIRGISEQTNLLALNAAIESARAGEHGRGFAVVADEVRALANRTSQSTTEIQTMISELTSTSDLVVNHINHSKSQAQLSVDAMQSSVELLNAINDAANEINDMATLIATATEEQSNVVADVGRNIEQISDISDNVMREQIDSEQAIKDLANSAQTLDDLVATFDKR